MTNTTETTSLKPTRKYGFDPVGIYGVYDMTSKKMMAINTFGNDRVAKINVKANISPNMHNDVYIVKLAEVDLYDPENMTIDGTIIRLADDDIEE